MPKSFTTARLEAFSDGVIAVIITIMVLDLKVPHAEGFEALREVLGTIGVYALSFTFVGVYWVNHHELVHRTERANNRILWSNLFWLFALSLVPFFTKFLVEEHISGFSVRIYSLSMLLAGATFLLLRYAVDCEVEHRGGTVTPIVLATRLKHWGSLALYVVAILIAGVVPRTALLCVAGVTLIWIVPTLGLFGRPQE